MTQAVGTHTAYTAPESKLENALEFDVPTPARKSGRNQYSLHLRHINTVLFRIKNAGPKGRGFASGCSLTKDLPSLSEHPSGAKALRPEANAPQSVDSTIEHILKCNFDRVVLKLTKREETKFAELLCCFTHSMMFDTYDKITQFSRTQYILDRGIISDIDTMNTTYESEKGL